MNSEYPWPRKAREEKVQVSFKLRRGLRYAVDEEVGRLQRLGFNVNFSSFVNEALDKYLRNNTGMEPSVRVPEVDS